MGSTNALQRRTASCRRRSRLHTHAACLPPTPAPLAALAPPSALCCKASHSSNTPPAPPAAAQAAAAGGRCGLSARVQAMCQQPLPCSNPGALQQNATCKKPCCRSARPCAPPLGRIRWWCCRQHRSSSQKHSPAPSPPPVACSGSCRCWRPAAWSWPTACSAGAGSRALHERFPPARATAAPPRNSRVCGSALHASAAHPSP